MLSFCTEIANLTERNHGVDGDHLRPYKERSHSTRKSIPKKKKKKKELKERERFLIMLFEHLDPAVLETRNGKF